MYQSTTSGAYGLKDSNNQRIRKEDVPGTYTIRKTITYTDIQLAATTNNIEIFQPDSNTQVCEVFIKHETEFVGGSIATLLASVGNTALGTPYQDYINSFDIFQSPGDTIWDMNRNIESLLNVSGITESIGLSVVSTGANLSELTQGEMDIIITLKELYSVAIMVP